MAILTAEQRAMAAILGGSDLSKVTTSAQMVGLGSLNRVNIGKTITAEGLFDRDATTKAIIRSQGGTFTAENTGDSLPVGGLEAGRAYALLNEDYLSQDDAYDIAVNSVLREEAEKEASESRRAGQIAHEKAMLKAEKRLATSKAPKASKSPIKGDSVKV